MYHFNNRDDDNVSSNVNIQDRHQQQVVDACNAKVRFNDEIQAKAFSLINTENIDDIMAGIQQIQDQLREISHYSEEDQYCTQLCLRLNHIQSILNIPYFLLQGICQGNNKHINVLVQLIKLLGHLVDRGALNDKGLRIDSFQDNLLQSLQNEHCKSYWQTHCRELKYISEGLRKLLQVNLLSEKCFTVIAKTMVEHLFALVHTKQYPDLKGIVSELGHLICGDILEDSQIQKNKKTLKQVILSLLPKLTQWVTTDIPHQADIEKQHAIEIASVLYTATYRLNMSLEDNTISLLLDKFMQKVEPEMNIALSEVGQSCIALNRRVPDGFREKNKKNAPQMNQIEQKVFEHYNFFHFKKFLQYEIKSQAMYEGIFVDFKLTIPSLKKEYIIEIDGLHHYDSQNELREKDKKRDGYLCKMYPNIKILRYPVNEVRNNGSIKELDAVLLQTLSRLLKMQEQTDTPKPTNSNSSEINPYAVLDIEETSSTQHHSQKTKRKGAVPYQKTSPAIGQDKKKPQNTSKKSSTRPSHKEEENLDAMLAEERMKNRPYSPEVQVKDKSKFSFLEERIMEMSTNINRLKQGLKRSVLELMIKGCKKSNSPEEIEFLGKFILLSNSFGTSVSIFYMLISFIVGLEILRSNEDLVKLIDTNELCTLYSENLSTLYILTCSTAGCKLLQDYPRLIDKITPDALCALRPPSVGIEANLSPIYSLTVSPEGLEILKNNQKLIDMITPDALCALRPLSAGQYANLSAIYFFTSTAQGREILKNNQKLIDKITPDALCALLPPSAGQYANLSAIYFLTSTAQGLEILKNNQKLIDMITPDALCALLPPSAGQYANLSAIYSLTVNPEGLEILKGNQKLIDKITPDALCALLPPSAGQYANLSAIYLLTASPEGLEILKGNQKLINMITPDVLCALRPPSAGQYANLSVIYFLTVNPEGLEILKNNQKLIDMITSDALCALLPPSAGQYANLSPLHFLTSSVQGLEILKNNQELIDKITSDALCALRPPSAGQYANLSPIYLLTENPEGREILRGNQKLINMITPDALCALRPPSAGQHANLSPIYFLTSTVQGLEILKNNQELIDKITPDALCALRPPSAGQHANLSPIYFLTSTAQGLEILKGNQELINMITPDVLCARLSPSAGQYANLSLLYCLTTNPVGREILRGNQKLINMITLDVLCALRPPSAGQHANLSPIYWLIDSSDGQGILKDNKKLIDMITCGGKSLLSGQSESAQCFYDKGVEKYNCKEYDQAIQNLQIAMASFKQQKKQEMMENCYSILALVYHNKGDIDSLKLAREYCQAALSITKSNDKFQEQLRKITSLLAPLGLM